MDQFLILSIVSVLGLTLLQYVFGSQQQIDGWKYHNQQVAVVENCWLSSGYARIVKTAVIGSHPLLNDKFYQSSYKLWMADHINEVFLPNFKSISYDMFLGTTDEGIFGY